MSTHSTVRHIRQISTRETHEEEQFFDVEEYTDSPFVEEADASQRQPLQDSTNRHMSPLKLARNSPSLLKNSLRDNEGLTRAVDAMEAEKDKENRSTPTHDPFKSSGFDPDDTCMSTFSMVPTADMTRLARLSLSPAKRSPNTSPSRSNRPLTPRSGQTGTPRMGRSGANGPDASPTPRRFAKAGSEEMTTQLLDFTEQLNLAAMHSPSRRAAAFRSPARNEATNLLDFDLPPAPTPRSLPTITARELEGLKAGFLSQISSLKATIDGKDATIKSLIDAKDDAERRVGDVSEELREAKDSKKAMDDEKVEWEKRDVEIRTLLQEVKSELVEREQERDDLGMQLEEGERRTEEAEARVREAEAKVEGMMAGEPHSDVASTPGSQDRKTRRAVDQAVEHVTRELHQLYKNKHDAKVVALKKSYEKRWEKRVAELERKIDELKQENDELRVGRDATMSGVVPSMAARGAAVDAATAMSPTHAASPSKHEEVAAAEKARAEAVAVKALEELRANVQAANEQLDAARAQTERLQTELEMSRAENSDLVAVVEEMLQLDPSAAAGGAAPGAPAYSEEEPAAEPPSGQAMSRLHSDSGADQFRSSTSEHAGATRPAAAKPSGLAKSGFGFASKAPALNRSMSGASGGRSGIMSNIERMGRGRAAE